MSRVIGLFVLASAVSLGSCVSKDAYRQAMDANSALQAERDDLSDHVAALEQQNRSLSDQVQGLSKVAADADWVREQRRKLQGFLQDLPQGSGGDLPPGVSFETTPEGGMLSVEGQVLFSSGQAEVTSGGRDTLAQLAAAIERGGHRVRVAGHTDSDPIRNSRWGTNLRLSAERALAVAESLISSGVPADRISIAGYGEYRPKANGTDDATKRVNRRVEILLLQ